MKNDWLGNVTEDELAGRMFISETGADRSNPLEALSRNLQHIRVSKKFKTVICIPIRESPKTKLTVPHVAHLFASQGEKVLVIDANMDRPTIHSSFSIPNSPGLTDILVQGLDIYDVISLHPHKENLSILPAGTRTILPKKLLKEERFNDVLTKVKSQFDILLINGPALSSKLLQKKFLRAVDAAVLIVNKGVVNNQQVVKAGKVLKRLSIEIIGSALIDN
ncbi:CpsD/CapB family tyrosine-protein kinase [Bacillus sp. FJAT-29790]|uniref:CpsD/CapB family tyrosine-protein kinase n=1 Tax=Bacillus sp. FJAT-29790 TaxID=1895002 RepID=UPI001C215247|nr:CpsD/CapB family tyrosine-protein kinase [Bacillus sp. FJAT-29790]MBU8880795.1 CpsD/CapB family tyrosine-protein kinase [Bacillus sp. FJAT-29790]